MAANVAKINSVGLRLALKELATADTLSALISGLWDWQDLPCNTMFPSCNISKDQS